MESTEEIVDRAANQNKKLSAALATLTVLSPGIVVLVWTFFVGYLLEVHSLTFLGTPGAIAIHFYVYKRLKDEGFDAMLAPFKKLSYWGFGLLCLLCIVLLLYLEISF